MQLLEEFHIGLLLWYQFLIKPPLNKTHNCGLWLIALDVNQTAFSWLSSRFWDRISCNVDQALCHMSKICLCKTCVCSASSHSVHHVKWHSFWFMFTFCNLFLIIYLRFCSRIKAWQCCQQLKDRKRSTFWTDCESQSRRPDHVWRSV